MFWFFLGGRECLGKGGSREQTYVIQEANSHLNN
jgi:hypothetical protein